MQSTSVIAGRSSLSAGILAVIGLFLSLALSSGAHAEPPAQAGIGAGAAGANGLPAFLKPGFRLSWIGGNSTLAGSHMVPDANGWIDWKGQKWSMQASKQTGGMGYSQISILHAEPQLIVADIRLFLLIDLEKGICASKSHALFVGNADALGDYWVNPAKLAQMQEGQNDTDTITRGTYVLANHPYKSISIRHQGRDGYSSKTYDRDTGLMLFGGTSDIDPTVYITHTNNGQVDAVEGNKQYSHNQFVAVRETKIPWAGARVSQWLTKGRRLDYTGTVTQANPGIEGLPGLPPLPGQATTLSYEVDKELAADCIAVKLLARYDLGRGIPPSEVKGSRAFGSTMLGGLWTPPDALRALQPNQVLDEDPVTRYRVSFVGIRGNFAMLIEQGPTDLLEQSYDLDSGLLVGRVIRAGRSPAWVRRRCSINSRPKTEGFLRKSVQRVHRSLLPTLLKSSQSTSLDSVPARASIKGIKS